jgi:hypothetical protein
LLNSEDNIYLIDTATGRIFKSPIFTSSKNKEDRFVYAAWKAFVKEKRLKFRDKIIFDSRNGNHVVEVQVVRRSK